MKGAGATAGAVISHRSEDILVAVRSPVCSILIKQWCMVVERSGKRAEIIILLPFLLWPRCTLVRRLRLIERSAALMTTTIRGIVLLIAPVWGSQAASSFTTCFCFQVCTQAVRVELRWKATGGGAVRRGKPYAHMVELHWDWNRNADFKAVAEHGTVYILKEHLLLQRYFSLSQHAVSLQHDQALALCYDHWQISRWTPRLHLLPLYRTEIFAIPWNRKSSSSAFWTLLLKWICATLTTCLKNRESCCSLLPTV